MLTWTYIFVLDFKG